MLEKEDVDFIIINMKDIIRVTINIHFIKSMLDVQYLVIVQKKNPTSVILTRYNLIIIILIKVVNSITLEIIQKCLILRTL